MRTIAGVEVERVDVYWSNSRRGFLVHVWGKPLVNARGKHRRFQSSDAAKRAAEKYIEEWRRVADESAKAMLGVSPPQTHIADGE